jgi:chemotaxis protein methyltransferase CheR
MMTNETSFFRDRALFEQFQRQTLPELMSSRRESGRIRIWCAACSTGQEPYSIAILLDEEQDKLKDWTVEILATDISETALAAARRGVYSQFEVQRGLSTSRLLRYFKQDGDHWSISEHLRSRVTFRRLNLASSFRELGPFDFVFCRNVLLYFDPVVKKDVLSRLSKVIADDGYLILGAAETAGEAGRQFETDSTDCTWLLRRRRVAPMRLIAAGAELSSAQASPSAPRGPAAIRARVRP